MRKLWLAASLLSLASICVAQTEAASFATELFCHRVDANIVYHTANNYQNKLDVYRPTEALQPTLDYDTKIATVVRTLGWCGMIVCIAWLAARALRDSSREVV